MQVSSQEFLPVEVVFHPNWWNTNYGFTFDRDYFFDPQTRVSAEQRHRQILHDRFGQIGLGEAEAEPRPVIGPVHLAAGYLVSGILGCDIRFGESTPPEVMCRNMTDAELMALDVPDVQNAYPMNKTMELIDTLESQYGFVEGDVNWSGLLNVAIDLRGQQFLIDYYENPGLVTRLLDIIYETTVAVVETIRTRTKTSSLSVNRIVGKVDPAINLHSNCSVTMISRQVYDEFHLPYERRLSERLAPYGVHHCGNDMHKVAASYAKFESKLFDVGWGSDVAACRKELPNAVFSLRIDPVQMIGWTPDDVHRELGRLILAAAPLERLAVCCINMDSAVPDENVAAIFQTVDEFRRIGA